jgi:hypothetical protein
MRFAMCRFFAFFAVLKGRLFVGNVTGADSRLKGFKVAF